VRRRCVMRHDGQVATVAARAGRAKNTRSAGAVTKHQLLLVDTSISSRASWRNRRKLRSWFLWGIAAKAIIWLATASLFFVAANRPTPCRLVLQSATAASDRDRPAGNGKKLTPGTYFVAELMYSSKEQYRMLPRPLPEKHFSPDAWQGTACARFLAAWKCAQLSSLTSPQAVRR
jgi:hypothetical protein